MGKSGVKWIKLDSKGRLSFPASFIRQMKEAVSEGFVLKRDVFDQCLILYPMNEWDRQTAMIRERTNPFNKEHARFLRMFYAGTAEITLDASNRILIPKRLIDHAGFKDEIVLAGQAGKVELWSAKLYSSVSAAGDEFAMLAEKILGGTSSETE